MNKIRIFDIILFAMLIAANIRTFYTSLDYNNSFWISNTFALIAIFLQIITHYIVYSKKQNVISLLFNISIVHVGFIYLSIQLIASIVVVIFSYFVPMWLISAFGLLLLGLFLIGVTAADNVANIRVYVNENRQKEISPMISMARIIEDIMKDIEQTVIKKKLEQLYQTFKYSDSNEYKETFGIEMDLQNQLQRLLFVVKSDNIGMMLEIIANMNNLLIERNQICSTVRENMQTESIHL